jgi:hypothetical protein
MVLCATAGTVERSVWRRRSGGSERRRLGRGCFYRPARSDDGAWAVASANRRARADIRGHWKVT